MKIRIYILVAIISAPAAQASTLVDDTVKARKHYRELSKNDIVISQKHKKLTVSQNHKRLSLSDKTLKVKTNQRVFLVNDEERWTHNVYDLNDKNWILRKQIPGGVASVIFTKPSKHEIRCAIHPKMKLTIIVSDQ